MTLENIKIKLLDGTDLNWKIFNGKHLLFVNVASECGFTPQYAQLQELYTHFNGSLEVIALPCNDFGNQEPGNLEEIGRFCQMNYGITFSITEKISIVQNPHLLIKYLCNSGDNYFDINWNFNKILVNRQGKVVERLGSSISPFDEKILTHLNN